MKLIALGDNVVDHYCNTGEYFPGGNAVNVAVHAARQGAQAEYLGAFGDDRAAEVLRGALRDAGVAFGRCPVAPGKTTKACLYNVVDGERSFVGIETGPTWVGPLQLREEDLAYLAGADLIVSSCNAKMPEQMEAVQKLAPVFAYDFGEKEKYRTADYYDQVCHGMDLAMLSCKPMSRREFAALCAPLHMRGVVHVLATMGARGEMLSTGKKILEKHTTTVTPCDTMGAGDSFLAAFLCSLMAAGWRKGYRMEDAALLSALDAGERTAAANCMSHGAFGCRALL